MNIQTEHLENQIARFTVEVDPDRLEKAKRASAKRLARRINIPGFRKGKAPYRVLVQAGLEGDILMDAIENLSQDVYRETLEQAEIEPYGPGSFDDYKIEPSPTFIYSVPLQPVVKLNDYRDIRVDFEMPEVTDEDVNEAMERLQEQEALVEESTQPVAVGNRIVADIHSEFADDPEGVEPSEESDEDEAESEAEETDEEHDHDHDHDHSHDSEESGPPLKGTMFIHEHDATLRLDPEKEPIMPGFIDAMVGSNVDEEVQFELTIPEDDEDYDEVVRGRKVSFHVNVKKIEVVTLPELNDDLAARITEQEEETLTLLQLRVRVRENLESELTRQTNSAYASEVLSKIVEQAELAYPQAMVEDQIDDMIKDLDSRLQQQGMNLETYMKVTGQGQEAIREQYQEPAENSLARGLVLREIVENAELTLSEDMVNARVDEMLSQFGEQAESLRSMFASEAVLNSIRNDLLQQRVMDFIAVIGKGEDQDEFIENMNKPAEVEVEDEEDDTEEPQTEAVEQPEEASSEEEETGDADSTETD